MDISLATLLERHARYRDSLPSELFDAARVDGANALHIFWKSVLSLTRSMQIVLASLTLVNLWKDLLPYLR